MTTTMNTEPTPQVKEINRQYHFDSMLNQLDELVHEVNTSEWLKPKDKHTICAALDKVEDTILERKRVR
jgi:hypothetical protein